MACSVQTGEDTSHAPAPTQTHGFAVFVLPPARLHAYARCTGILLQVRPLLRLQVACFCSTVMATQTVVTGQLPIGRTQAESEQLLRQTTEALEAQLRSGHRFKAAVC